MTSFKPGDPDPLTICRLYGRSSSHKLRQGQQALIDRLLPELAVPAEGPVTPRALFGDERPLHFEIGFGSGEHLAHRADLLPDHGFVGCEPFLNGVAAALVHVRDGPLGNVRLHMGDALGVLARVPDGALLMLYLLHPDPWPKARHAKRRFMNTGPIDLVARCDAAYFAELTRGMPRSADPALVAEHWALIGTTRGLDVLSCLPIAALGQDQRELAVGAVQPVALASQPQLIAVAEQPVGVGLLGGDLGRGGAGHPALGQQPPALPDAVAAVQLAHRGEVARADMDPRPTEAASHRVTVPRGVDTQRFEQARTQVVEQVLAVLDELDVIGEAALLEGLPREHPILRVVLGDQDRDRASSST